LIRTIVIIVVDKATNDSSLSTSGEKPSYEDLVALVLEQRAIIAQLQKRVAELEQQLGLGGPPPPSVSIKSSKPKSASKKRKPRHLQFTRHRDIPGHTVDHLPESCPDCGRTLQGGGPGRSRQVVDIPSISVQITDHVLHDRWCGVCRKRVRAQVDFSPWVIGKRRIGHNLASWIVNLHIGARVPIRTIQSILKQLCSVHISIGEISDLLSAVAKKANDTIQTIKEEVRSSSVLHADETGWRQNGEYRCLWSLSTRTARWFHIDERRTAEVASHLVGENIDRTLVTDFYAAYNHIPGRHQRCWPHFQRALEKLRLHPLVDRSLNEWIDAVLHLWSEGRKYRAFCLSAPRFGASVFDRKRMRQQLERKLYALAEPYLEADSEHVPQATLARRIGLFLGELFTFVEYPEVPDDNNAAERAIRPAVILRKVCGGTRSQKGTSVKADLMTLVATWNLQGKDPIAECKAILTKPINATH
jgi:transposase